MLDGLANREGAAIRTSPIAGGAILSGLAVEGDAKVADVPVDRVEAIPAPARTALVDAGVVKLGDLAGTDVPAVTTGLRTRAVNVTSSDVAGWIGVAKTLVNVNIG